MHKIFVIVVAVLLAIGVMWPQLEGVVMMQAIRASHIEGNTPVGKDFDTFLKRDLKAHFLETDKTITDVQYHLLRDEATQVGVGYPKYYVWVKALAGTTVKTEGAAELAAIDKTEFDVFSFIPKADIEANPKLLSPDLYARTGLKAK